MNELLWPEQYPIMSRSTTLEMVCVPNEYDIYAPAEITLFGSMVGGYFYSVCAIQDNGELAEESDCFDRRLLDETFPVTLLDWFYECFDNTNTFQNYRIRDYHPQLEDGIFVVRNKNSLVSTITPPHMVEINGHIPLFLIVQAYPMDENGMIMSSGLNALPIFIVRKGYDLKKLKEEVMDLLSTDIKDHMSSTSSRN